MVDVLSWPILFAIFFVFIFATKAIIIIRPYEKGLVERLGRFQRTVDSGLKLIIPFIESIIKVDMREQVIDVPPHLEICIKINLRLCEIIIISLFFHFNPIARACPFLGL